MVTLSKKKKILISVIAGCLLMGLLTYLKYSHYVKNAYTPPIIARTTPAAADKNIPVKNNAPKNEFQDISLEKIERKEAGLSDYLEFKSEVLLLNSRIKMLIEDNKSYSDSDYKNGIILLKSLNHSLLSDCIGCDSTYSEVIFNNIRIGSNVEDVVTLLGKPNYIYNDFSYFVSTNKTYVIVKGREKIENVFFAKYENRIFPLC